MLQVKINLVSEIFFYRDSLILYYICALGLGVYHSTPHYM